MARAPKTPMDLLNQYARIVGTLTATRQGTWGSDGMPYTENKFEHDLRRGYVKNHPRKSSKAYWKVVDRAREMADGEADRLRRKAITAFQNEMEKRRTEHLSAQSVNTKAKGMGGRG